MAQLPPGVTMAARNEQTDLELKPTRHPCGFWRSSLHVLVGSSSKKCQAALAEELLAHKTGLG